MFTLALNCNSTLFLKFEHTLASKYEQETEQEDIREILNNWKGFIKKRKLILLPYLIKNYRIN